MLQSLSIHMEYTVFYYSFISFLQPLIVLASLPPICIQCGQKTQTTIYKHFIAAVLKNIGLILGKPFFLQMMTERYMLQVSSRQVRTSYLVMEKSTAFNSHSTKESS